MCKSGERHDHFQVHPPVSLDDATYLIALGQGVGTRQETAVDMRQNRVARGGQRGEGTSATSAVRSLSAVSAIPSDWLEAVACGFCVPPAAAATCISRSCAAASCSRSASLSPLCPLASALNTESANLSDMSLRAQRALPLAHLALSCRIFCSTRSLSRPYMHSGLPQCAVAHERSRSSTESRCHSTFAPGPCGSSSSLSAVS